MHPQKPILDYQQNPKQTPAWKHVVFAPLLVFIGMFIVAMLIVLILAFVRMVHR